MAAATGYAGSWWSGHRRRSRAVSSWRRGSGERRPPGALAARLLGADGPPVVLLHGLAGSGEEWGAGWDRLAACTQMIVPDLLGFGRSRSLAASAYDVTEHLDALDRLLVELDVRDPPLLAGHSMGAVLALAWAARRAAQDRPVRHVVGFAAPLYVDAAEADRTLAASDPVNKLMTAPGRWPRLLCDAVCGGPWWGQALYVAANPWYPPALAREGVWHSWASYRRSLDQVLRIPVWSPALRDCLAAGTPVLLAGGATDRVVVAGRDADLAHDHYGLRVASHPTAGHDLPISEPGWCVDLVAGALDAGDRPAE